MTSLQRALSSRSFCLRGDLDGSRHVDFPTPFVRPKDVPDDSSKRLPGGLPDLLGATVVPAAMRFGYCRISTASPIRSITS